MLINNKYIGSASNYKDSFILVLTVLFAVGFYFLLTVTYKGNDIRISTTDFFLPFPIIFLIYEIYKYKQIPNLKIKHGWLWFVVLSIWILVSFFVGIYYTGEVQEWALVNKVIGWFVLMGYFLCGVWLCDKNKIVKHTFLMFFFGAAFLISLYGLYSYWMTLYGFYIPIEYSAFRIQGFSENPNSFGIMMACILILQIPFIKNGELFKKYIHYFTASIIILAIYYSLSRSAWLGVILGIIGILFIKRSYWKTIIVLLFCFIIMNIVFFKSPVYINSFISEYIYSEKLIERNKILQPYVSPMYDSKLYGPVFNLVNPVNKAYATDFKKNVLQKGIIEQRTSHINDSNISVRLDMFKRAIRYWMEYPIVGIGIGSYQWKSKQAGENPHGYFIHNTGIWLLTETGLVGFLLFFSFFLVCFITFIGKKNIKDSLSVGMAGMLLVMLGASIGTEILYQRYLWFMLGFTLAVNKTIIEEEFSIHQSII